MTEQPPPRTPAGRRAPFWIPALLLAAFVILLAVLADRPATAVAVAVGVALPFGLWWAWRFLRATVRTRTRMVVLLVSVIGLTCAGVLFVLRTSGDGCCPMVRETISMPYAATVDFTGTRYLVHEVVTVDEKASKKGNPRPDPADGWQLSRIDNGFNVFARTSAVAARRSNWVARTEIPIDLGRAIVTTTPHALSARDGSVVKVRAPKGAVAATYPPAGIADMLQGQEEATVPVDGGVEAVRVAVLPSYLRNPAGHAVYAVAEWGPLPWALGMLGLLIGAVVWEKLVGVGTGLLGRVFAALKPRNQPSPPPKKPSPPPSRKAGRRTGKRHRHPARK
jgi:hypothetical protein